MSWWGDKAGGMKLEQAISKALAGLRARGLEFPLVEEYMELARATSTWDSSMRVKADAAILSLLKRMARGGV